MIRSSDIDRLLNRRARQRGSIEEWCRRNDVDESVMRRLVAVYGFNRAAAVAAIDAFRLGHEARREDEPRARRFGASASTGPRYAVQLVIIDRADGRIVGGPTGDKAYADGLAATYNEIDAQPAQDP